MLNVLLTFDYELFLGENHGSYEDILFSPTEKLLQMLQQTSAKVTFFADVCSAIVHQQHGLSQYPQAFRRQLQDIIRQGHDVQLHLHTSWYRAKRQGDVLILGPEGYRIHEFGFDSEAPLSAQAIVAQGKQYLQEVCGEADSQYRCIAFRAGGFGIQPEQNLLQALRENGIYIDSSVIPRMKNTRSANWYDFSSVPRELNWWVDPQKGLSRNVPGENSLYEIPVATARPALVKCLGLPKEKLSLPPSKPLGTYVSLGKSAPVSKLSRLFHRLFDYRYVSLDTRYYERVLDDLAAIYSRHHLDKNDACICLICHPKLLDGARIENIRLLIQALSQDERFCLATFQDVASRLV